MALAILTRTSFDWKSDMLPRCDIATSVNTAKARWWALGSAAATALRRKVAGQGATISSERTNGGHASTGRVRDTLLLAVDAAAVIIAGCQS
jgi:hypothetical protein